MKEAIILATFGSSYTDTIKKTILPLKKDLEEKFPLSKVFVGFTSKIIINKLKRSGIEINTVDEILTDLETKNFNSVCIFTNLLIPGTEFNKLLKIKESYKNHFNKFELTSPFLTNINDIQKITKYLINQITDFNKSKFYLFMGHGSDHPNNYLYEEINKQLQQLGFKNIKIVCIDGDNNFQKFINSNELDGYKDIFLSPFMLTSGDHVKNDMIKNEDSWLNQLKEKGFLVSYSTQGLEESKKFRELILSD